MFLSTYARLFIGFNEALSSMVIEHSRQSQSKKTRILPITILSVEQINQALFHPQSQALKDLIGTAYADSINADRKIIYGQESLKEQSIFIEETLKTLTQKKKNATAATGATIDNTLNALNQQYKLLSNIKTAQDHGIKQLAGLRESIDEISTKHNQEWSNYREKMLTKLHSVLKAEGIDLPQGEVDNFMRLELQDLLDRFENLGAHKDLSAEQMTKLIGLRKPDLDTYFKMKAYLAIRSVHISPENIGKYMQKLDTVFKEAKEEGKQLLEKQEAEIKTIDVDKVNPIIQVAESNNKTLDRLKDDRQELLKATATLKDIDTIREKTELRIAEVKPSAAPSA